MKDKKIGFIGLGNVGAKLAENIIKFGFELYVFDIDKSALDKFVNKKAIICNSLQKLTEESSIIITCLPSPDAVNIVILEILPFLQKKHLWLEMSTTDENELRKLSKLCNQKGAQTLEAPVTGGQHRAETGNISILVGGERKNFDRAFPVLSSMGYEILFCGKLGKATTLKVVTNFLASINLLSLGEALMVCKKYGLDLNTAFHGIKISSGNSFVHETESKVILNGSYDVGFTMDLVCKDIGLFDKLADKYKIPAELSKLINKIFNEGRKMYGDRAFSTSIVKILEDACKEELRAPGFPSKLIDKEIKKIGIEIKF